MAEKNHVNENTKNENLQPYREGAGDQMTTNQGVKVNDTDNSLKVGTRGPSLQEDFLFQEKLSHLDRERIPERVVHARGSGAHGYFQPYESMAEFTKAKFLQDPATKTPVFVRFSTVGGSRGSADSVRDARGFSVKFYTEDGNYDLVGNNIPVFFIQDAIKFPDIVHAIKPEPDHEMPQASTAHPKFLGLHFTRSRIDSHDHVDFERPHDSQKLSHDAGVWCPHFPVGQCRWQIAFCEISLEADRGRSLKCLRRSTEACWQRP